jgi:hypothetical protein
LAVCDAKPLIINPGVVADLVTTDSIAGIEEDVTAADEPTTA